ncbi:MAG TPA: hypothetical protein VET25_12465, partial [Aestuariivirgaceae bacterium]|nr:hypothetical protein [Aestuariivirgaceae bacterium]
KLLSSKSFPCHLLSPFSDQYSHIVWCRKGPSGHGCVPIDMLSRDAHHKQENYRAFPNHRG